MQRAQRKLEHIKFALETGFGPGSTHFEDIRFIHNCLPEINPADIVLSADLFGKMLKAPFLIDAITGGTDAVTDVNRRLAEVASKTGIAMAVGSQYGSVKSGVGRNSYTVVREMNPDGIIFANISALATPQQAQDAVNMIEADALEIHLNPAQELVMPEGDKCFRGFLDNMLLIRDKVDVPIIVKETGCGIAQEAYEILADNGFTFFDCAGSGGTNFTAIEAKRADVDLEELAFWGNPTAWSVLDAAVTLDCECFLIASGGIDSAAKVVKAFALGADMVGMSGVILQLLSKQGTEAAIAFIEKLQTALSDYMLLLGCQHVKELREVPMIFCGQTKDFMQCRNYDLVSLSKKRR